MRSPTLYPAFGMSKAWALLNNQCCVCRGLQVLLPFATCFRGTGLGKPEEPYGQTSEKAHPVEPQGGVIGGGADSRLPLAAALRK